MLHTLCLQGPEGDSVVQKALADPHKYVLKPQREGGGKYSLFIINKYSLFIINY